MAKFVQSAIGLEITEEFLVLSHITNTDEGLVVDKCNTITIPPKAVSNGEITDPDMLAAQVSKTLAEGGYDTTNMVVGINDSEFIKRIDRIPSIGQDAIFMELEAKVAASSFFQNTDAEIAFQMSEIQGEGKKFKPLLYAGYASSKIEAIREMVDIMGLNLVAVDLIPLALSRLMTWGDHLVDTPFISLVLEKNLLDVNVVIRGEIVFTTTIRRLADELVEKDDVFQETVIAIENFLLAFTNFFPDKVSPQKLVLFSRVERKEVFFEKVQEAFKEFYCFIYAPSQNLKFHPQFGGKEKIDSTVLKNAGSLGLALKFFERQNKTLSLTKVRKQLGPFINKFELGASVLVLAGIIAIFGGIIFYLNASVSRIGVRVLDTKAEIRELQSGEFLLRQKRLERMQRQIDGYDQLRKDKFAKAQFLTRLANELPEDITFTHFIIDEKNRSTIRGVSYSQDSIHVFFKQLKRHYSDVTLRGITIRYDEKTGVPTNEFEIAFKWS
ncbi:MAG: hypothetical protein ACI9BD_000455 [Candidatus Marinamargulisbacteria bacterium]|jgi:hypothetical protein